MTIGYYLRLMRDRWLSVALVTVLATVSAMAFSFTASPVYESSTQLFVSTSAAGNDAAQLSQGGSFMQQRVKSYTSLIKSPRVLRPVIAQLRLGTTAAELAGRVTTSSAPDTVLIDVMVRDTSARRASDTANAIAAQFPQLVKKLETPSGQTTSPVSVSVTVDAEPAERPVSPRKGLNFALGLVVGLVLGFGAAVLRDSLDRTVTGRTQASEVAGAPVLGVIGEESNLQGKALIVHDAFSPRAEAFRQLRTNIRFLSVDQQISSLVVTGSVQSEGKTTTAANIAIALAQSGEHVVLIDADLRRPTVADLFGLSAGVGLTSVLLGDMTLDEALQRWRDDLELDVLASGSLPPNPSELIGSARMAEIIQTLTGRGITVVVDSPPLLPVTDGAVLARITDGALLVARVASTRLDQLSAAVTALRTAGAPVLGVVLNRAPKRGKGALDDAFRRGYNSYERQAQPVSMPLPLGVGVVVPNNGSPQGFDTVLTRDHLGARPGGYVLPPDYAAANGYVAANGYPAPPYGYVIANGYATNGYQQAPPGYDVGQESGYRDEGEQRTGPHEGPPVNEGPPGNEGPTRRSMRQGRN